MSLILSNNQLVINNNGIVKFSSDNNNPHVVTTLKSTLTFNTVSFTWDLLLTINDSPVAGCIYANTETGYQYDLSYYQLTSSAFVLAYAKFSLSGYGLSIPNNEWIPTTASIITRSWAARWGGFGGCEKYSFYLNPTRSLLYIKRRVVCGGQYSFADARNNFNGGVFFDPWPNASGILDQGGFSGSVEYVIYIMDY